MKLLTTNTEIPVSMPVTWLLVNLYALREPHPVGQCLTVGSHCKIYFRKTYLCQTVVWSHDSSCKLMHINAGKTVTHSTSLCLWLLVSSLSVDVQATECLYWPMLGLQCAIVGGFSNTVVGLRSGATGGSPAVTVHCYTQDSQPLLEQHSPRMYQCVFFVGLDPMSVFVAWSMVDILFIWEISHDLR